MVAPFAFYSTSRFCPHCRARLVTATPLTRQFTQGLLQRLGITSYCVSCNRRYRATSWLFFPWIAWAGPIGRWLWWKTTSLEETLSPDLLQ